MKNYICNVFTTAMFPLDDSRIRVATFTPVDEAEARFFVSTCPFVSAVGHPATCKVLTQRLGAVIEPSRLNVQLLPQDVLLVAQLVVPRLEEGQVLTEAQVKDLPIAFWHVTYQYANEM